MSVSVPGLPAGVARDSKPQHIMVLHCFHLFLSLFFLLNSRQNTVKMLGVLLFDGNWENSWHGKVLISLILIGLVDESMQ